MTGPVGSCRCGHGQDAHEHYREGTDCSRRGCGCEAFEQAAGAPPISPELRRLLAVALGVPAAVVAVGAVAILGDLSKAAAVLLALLGGLSVCWLIRPRPRDHDEER